MTERMVCKRCDRPIAPGTGYVRINGRPAHLVCPAREKSRRRAPARRISKER